MKNNNLTKLIKRTNLFINNYGVQICMLVGIIFILTVSFSETETYGRIYAIIPNQDYIEIDTVMDDGSIQAYDVDWDTPIPNDATIVEFRTFKWNENDYTTYRIHNII